MRRLVVRGAVLASRWVVCHSAGVGRRWAFLGVRSVYSRVRGMGLCSWGVFASWFAAWGWGAGGYDYSMCPLYGFPGI